MFKQKDLVDAGNLMERVDELSRRNYAYDGNSSMDELSKKRSTSELRETEGEDTFRESKKIQFVHIERALVSYLIDSESIQQDQRTIVYDY